MNGEENRNYIFKVAVVSIAAVSVLLIGAGIFVGLFFFFKGEHDLEKIAERNEIYSSEIYNKRYGDRIVKELVLNQGVDDINQTDSQGRGGLYWAIKLDNIKAAEFLIENNADIEITSDDGTTPLVLAIEENKPKIAEILIKKGNANIYGTYTGNNPKKYPIYSAVANTNQNMIKLLINNSLDLKREAGILNYAIENSSENIARYLIENGADINYKNADGTTALYNAVLSLNPNLVNYFLEKNASIEEAGESYNYGNIIMAAAGSKFNSRNDNFPVDLELLEKSSQNSAKITETIIGIANKNFINDYNYNKTPLIVAAGNSYLETVKKLIENGADVNKYDGKGWTPLMYAANNGDIEIAKILIENKANVNQKSFDSKTALLYAVNSPILESRIDMAKLLIESKADINLEDAEGFKPLSAAIKNKDAELTKFLTTNKADLNIFMPTEGSSLIEYAINQNDMDLLQLLVENGANINFPNINSDGTFGMTPLMLASRLGLDNIIRIFLSREAEINLTDFYGNTAVHYAAGNSQLAAVRLLLDKNPNLNIQNKDGNTALHLAVISGNIDIVSEIVLKGADTRIRNNDRKYPIDIARENNNAGIFEVLRESEMNFNGFN